MLTRPTQQHSQYRWPNQDCVKVHRIAKNLYMCLRDRFAYAIYFKDEMVGQLDLKLQNQIDILQRYIIEIDLILPVLVDMYTVAIVIAAVKAPDENVKASYGEILMFCIDIGNGQIQSARLGRYDTNLASRKSESRRIQVNWIENDRILLVILQYTHQIVVHAYKIVHNDANRIKRIAYGRNIINSDVFEAIKNSDIEKLPILTIDHHLTNNMLYIAINNVKAYGIFIISIRYVPGKKLLLCRRYQIMDKRSQVRKVEYLDAILITKKKDLNNNCGLGDPAVELILIRSKKLTYYVTECLQSIQDQTSIIQYSKWIQESDFKNVITTFTTTPESIRYCAVGNYLLIAEHNKDELPKTSIYIYKRSYQYVYQNLHVPYNPYLDFSCHIESDEPHAVLYDTADHYLNTYRLTNYTLHTHRLDYGDAYVRYWTHPHYHVDKSMPAVHRLEFSRRVSVKRYGVYDMWCVWMSSSSSLSLWWWLCVSWCACVEKGEKMRWKYCPNRF